MAFILAKAAPGTDWAAVAAWAAWVTVGIYVVIGLFAWRQVREAPKLREEQARPFVIVDFEPGFLVYLTVENLGRTMARDVRISFDKPLISTFRDRRQLDESPLFREPIPALPPGKKISVLFDQFTERMKAQLPLTYDVEVRYRGPTGKEWPPETAPPGDIRRFATSFKRNPGAGGRGEEHLRRDQEMAGRWPQWPARAHARPAAAGPY